MLINEIFYSLQGEGYNSGTAAVFVRLSGCNLRCPFCDTRHESGTEMSEEEILAQVSSYPANLVVITGGEPSLQLTETLVDALHGLGRKVAVETNGTHALPPNVDWITLSPKDLFFPDKAHVVLTSVNELKMLFDGIHEPCEYSNIEVSHGRFLQPCDTGNATENEEIVRHTVDYVKQHPEWRLSLQIHKLLNIP